MKKLILILLLIFVGCKDTFVPISYNKTSSSEYLTLKYSDYYNASFDGLGINKSSQEYNLSKNEKLIYSNINRYITTVDFKHIDIKDQNRTVMFDFETQIASVSILDNFLACLFVDNSIALYDVDTRVKVFGKKYKNVTTVTKNIAKPIFFGDVIIFPTLNGRLVFVDGKSKNIQNIIILSNEDFFNNIIYLDMLGNKIVASTRSKVISLTPENIYEYSDAIKNIVPDLEHIYVLTRDSRVVDLDNKLEVITTTNYKYANFVNASLVRNSRLFLLEEGGYLIDYENNKSLKLFNKIKTDSFFSFDKVYVNNKSFYIE